VARELVGAVDVWLNTPRRGEEACGTSGMKAGMNGVLNLSIPDGWFDEAAEDSGGWMIGGRVEIGDLPMIDADSLQIRQLFQNLVGNALKFHRKDEKPVIKIYSKNYSLTGGSFFIEGEQVHTDGENSCEIVIEDNGIGFEEKYLDRIFTVFQRLHGRSEYEGSGIGLAVCRKIVERHGGQITASSQPGKGSTFLVTLPIKQFEEDR
jgi:signal transduction histidine kinase